MINITAIQDCPNLCFDDRNIMRCSNGNSGDFSNYVVPGARDIIQVFLHVQETLWQLIKYP